MRTGTVRLDEVETLVLALDIPNRRISLGLKQVEPNPWEVIGEKFPVGTIIEGQVKNITDFGLFVGIDEGIDGLIHISDISWTKRIKHPNEIYKKGDLVQAIVLDIDKENERFSLGIKQLQQDPWKTVAERYDVGKEITGTVTNVTDFGVFVELEEGIEGLVHVSSLGSEYFSRDTVHRRLTGERSGRSWQLADTVKVRVIRADLEQKKIDFELADAGPRGEDGGRRDRPRRRRARR